ncbi:hypothetical protein CASFOL_035426 [Castilleja foliolosa]|uniref:F-box/LRR-repeat protein 15/At3g58940/PEG3-like LRR domain-containing protein n=1 Tax=Castilleja foliolosa TaxID=1961234 RepID=A0ABD3BTT6_9LAMI
MLWQFRWTQSPRLVFGKIGNWIPEADVQDLVSRVNRTLVIYGRNDLDTFELEFPYSKSYSPDVNAASNYVSECIPETAEVVGMHCGNNRVAVVDRATHQESELQQHVMDKMLSGRPVLRCLILLGFRSFGGVKRVLVVCGLNNLDTFELDFPYSKIYSPDVNVWVGFAVKSKAKRVSLSINHVLDDYYTLPQTIFQSAFVKQLTLRECTVAPRGAIEWPSLTKLHIEGAELQQHVIEKILSGCPVLHCLVLEHWSTEVMSNAMELLEKVRHVKVVDLRYGYIKVLSLVAISDYRFPQSARTCLTVEVPTEECSIHVLVDLLESSPNLETSNNFLGNGLCTCLDSKIGLDCDLLHFTDKTLDGEPMLILARILLNKAPALEKMVVHNEIFIQSPSRYRKHY